MKLHRFVWIALLLSAAASLAPGAETLLSSDFDSPPTDGDWAFVGIAGRWDPWIAGEEGDRRVVVPSAGHFEGLQTRDLDVEPGRYVKVSFRALPVGGPAFAAGLWYDADGNEMRADHYHGMARSKEWTDQEFIFRCRHNADGARVRFRAINGGSFLHVDDVTVAALTDAEALAWLDALYADLPPIEYEPPQQRWRHIPETIAALREGRTWKVVVLGDSIANDLDNSGWELLLTKAYPKADLSIITSIEGGKGMEFYREDGRVKKYVLDHEPDLVIIGGISTGSADAVRDVIRQIRETSDPEILVMSGAFGSRHGQHYRPPRGRQWSPEIDPDGEGYRSALLRVAREENVEFLDLRGATDAYFRKCGRPASDYMRDVVHPNDLGRAILGRILARYLSPSDE